MTTTVNIPEILAEYGADLSDPVGSISRLVSAEEGMLSVLTGDESEKNTDDPNEMTTKVLRRNIVDMFEDDETEFSLGPDHEVLSHGLLVEMVANVNEKVEELSPVFGFATAVISELERVIDRLKPIRDYEESAAKRLAAFNAPDVSNDSSDEIVTRIKAVRAAIESLDTLTGGVAELDRNESGSIKFSRLPNSGGGRSAACTTKQSRFFVDGESIPAGTSPQDIPAKYLNDLNRWYTWSDVAKLVKDSGQPMTEWEIEVNGHTLRMETVTEG